MWQRSTHAMTDKGSEFTLTADELALLEEVESSLGGEGLVSLNEADLVNSVPADLRAELAALDDLVSSYVPGQGASGNSDHLLDGNIRDATLSLKGPNSVTYGNQGVGDARDEGQFEKSDAQSFSESGKDLKPVGNGSKSLNMRVASANDDVENGDPKGSSGESPTLAGSYVARKLYEMVTPSDLEPIALLQTEALSDMSGTTEKLRAFNIMSREYFDGDAGKYLHERVREVAVLMQKMSHISRRVQNLQHRVAVARSASLMEGQEARASRSDSLS